MGFPCFSRETHGFSIFFHILCVSKRAAKARPHIAVQRDVRMKDLRQEDLKGSWGHGDYVKMAPLQTYAFWDLNGRCDGDTTCDFNGNVTET